MMLIFAAATLLTVGVDLATKVLAVNNLDPGSPVKIAGGAVYFTLIRNSGAAFGMGTDFTLALAILAIVVVTGIVTYAWFRLGSFGWSIALGLVSGGALGNLVDRIFRAPSVMRGEVVDFISLFHPYGKGWAIFNVADSCLVVGVILIVAMELFGRSIEGPKVADKKDES